MLGSVVTFQSLRYFFAGTLHTTVAELCQLYRITLAGEDRIQNRLPAGSGNVAQYVMDLQVHLAERLLHMQDVLGGHLQQASPMSPKRTYCTDVHGWAEAGPQQSNRVQILNPLTIGDIALAARNTLQVARVDQIDFQTSCFQDLKQRNPVHPSGLHRHRANSTLHKPIRQSMQIAGEAAEHAYGFFVTIRRNSHVDFFCPDVNTGSIRLQYNGSALSLLSFLRHRFLLVRRTRPEARNLAVF